MNLTHGSTLSSGSGKRLPIGIKLRKNEMSNVCFASYAREKMVAHDGATGSGVVNWQECKHKTLLVRHFLGATALKMHNLIHS